MKVSVQVSAYVAAPQVPGQPPEALKNLIVAESFDLPDDAWSKLLEAAGESVPALVDALKGTAIEQNSGKQHTGFMLPYTYRDE